MKEKKYRTKTGKKSIKAAELSDKGWQDIQACLGFFGTSLKLLDCFYDSIIISDINGRVFFWNKAAEKIYGWSAKEVKDKFVHNLLAIKFPGSYEEVRTELLQNGEWDGELEETRRDGASVWVKSRLVLCKDSNNAPCAILHINNDITGHKQAERALLESEEKYGAILQRSLDGIVIIQGARVMFANQSALKMFGCSKAGEMVGRDFEEFVLPESRYLVTEKSFLLVKEHPSISYEFKAVRRDGGCFDMELFASIISYKGEMAILGILRDSSERKIIEEELQLAHRRLIDIIEFLPDATFVIDRDKRVIAWNRAIERMTGVNKRDIIGKGDYAYAVPFYGKRRPILIDLVGMHNKEIEAKYSYVKRDKDTLYAEVFVPAVFNKKGAFLWAKASPLYDREGDLTGAIETVRDITARKNAENVLRRDKDTFKKLVRQKTKELLDTQKALAEARRLSDIGTLAATVAHELRNPLGVILTAVYNVRMKSNNRGIEKHLVNIERKIMESNQIINNLLNYSRIKMPVYEQIEIYRILNECIGFAKKKFYKYKVTMENKLAPIKKLVISSDPVQLREVFNNILDNAYQAFLHKKGKIRINAYFDDKDYLRISFKDNGPGIDAKDMDHIFTPFFTTKSKGTGLGLTICNDLVNLLGGKIYVETKRGEGTTITVSLPLIMKDKQK